MIYSKYCTLELKCDVLININMSHINSSIVQLN